MATIMNEMIAFADILMSINRPNTWPNQSILYLHLRYKRYLFEANFLLITYKGTGKKMREPSDHIGNDTPTLDIQKYMPFVMNMVIKGKVHHLNIENVQMCLKAHLEILNKLIV